MMLQMILERAALYYLEREVDEDEPAVIMTAREALGSVVESADDLSPFDWLDFYRELIERVPAPTGFDKDSLDFSTWDGFFRSPLILLPDNSPIVALVIDAIEARLDGVSYTDHLEARKRNLAAKGHVSAYRS